MQWIRGLSQTSSQTLDTNCGAAGLVNAARCLAMSSEPSKRKEIYTYEAPWVIFAMAWSQRDLKTEPGLGFRLAIGSFIEEYANKVQIVQRRDVHEQQAEPAGGGDGAGAAAQNSFVRVGEFDHPYPATKILWSPDRGAGKDLLATTGDYLRVWNVVDTKDGAPPADGPGGVKMVALLNNNKNSEYCAPLTSFDWNETDPSLIGTSSIDTTCTIWDLNVRANPPSGISRSTRAAG